MTAYAVSNDIALDFGNIKCVARRSSLQATFPQHGNGIDTIISSVLPPSECQVFRSAYSKETVESHVRGEAADG